LVRCGTDSVVLHWEDTVLVVGPFGDWIKFSYEGVVHLVPEIDGVRIISNELCEFLQRVPAATEDTFKPGSVAPGALLYVALEKFEKKSSEADEGIRNIGMDMTQAVDTCIDAAGHEIHPPRQRSLLKAASFGKCVLEAYNTRRFVNMCQALRVLNAVRHYEIGVPLTYAQYVRLTPEVLVNRLINRHHHLLALRICDYLGMNRDRVLIHWACAKINAGSAEDEESLCRLIVDKLGGDKAGISYTEVAKAAFGAGRVKLATKLLDYEPQAANQVPLLLDMRECELALIKAIESGDTDLVYLVMLHMQRSLPTAELFRILNGKPLACNLLETYLKEQDLELLRQFYDQDDRRAESANVMAIASFKDEELAPRIANLKKALKQYQDDRGHPFEVK
ncbi:Vps16, N-terminal region-domain-containing protein, partial [Blyttiomyces helicus]